MGDRLTQARLYCKLSLFLIQGITGLNPLDVIFFFGEEVFVFFIYVYRSPCTNFYTLTSVCIIIRRTVHYTFPKVLTRRISSVTKGFFSLWPFPLLSWISCFIQGDVRRNYLLVTLGGQDVMFHYFYPLKSASSSLLVR